MAAAVHQRRLAQFASSGGFLGVGGWRPDPVPILTAVTAADELHQVGAADELRFLQLYASLTLA